MFFRNFLRASVPIYFTPISLAINMSCDCSHFFFTTEIIVRKVIYKIFLNIIDSKVYFR